LTAENYFPDRSHRRIEFDEREMTYHSVEQRGQTDDASASEDFRKLRRLLRKA
jgi:hypothetical protein